MLQKIILFPLCTKLNSQHIYIYIYGTWALEEKIIHSKVRNPIKNIIFDLSPKVMEVFIFLGVFGGEDLKVHFLPQYSFCSFV